MIESMEVLKDAASLPSMVRRRANGVVIITTKTGAANGGRAQISIAASSPSSRWERRLKSLMLLSISSITKY